MSAYAPFLLQLGFIDRHGYHTLNVNAEKMKTELERKKFVDALQSDIHSLDIIERVFGVNLNHVMMSTKHEADGNHEHVRFGICNAFKMMYE